MLPRPVAQRTVCQPRDFTTLNGREKDAGTYDLVHEWQSDDTDDGDLFVGDTDGAADLGA